MRQQSDSIQDDVLTDRVDGCDVEAVENSVLDDDITTTTSQYPDYIQETSAQEVYLVRDTSKHPDTSLDAGSYLEDATREGCDDSNTSEHADAAAVTADD